MLSHTLITDFHILIVPEESEEISMIFLYFEPVKHFLNVTSNGDLVFTEPEKYSKQGVVQIRPGKQSTV